jgi:UDP-GlcNAc:undecaprenyl-phosphate GlcNAc-1-phosphate transferase
VRFVAVVNFTLAIILSLVITPAAIKLCILDKPNYRKIHDKPIPKGGGIGIFIPAILLELNTFLFFSTYITLDTFKYFTIMLVTFVLLLVGIIDDKLELGSKSKLCIQIIITILTLSSGIRFHAFGIEALDLLLTAVWIIGIINAVNLIDGLDGLAAGIAVISCVGFSFIGYVYGDKTITMLSLIIIGGCLGFLKYNFRPARIFMGDTGSVPLGYNLAIIGILCENVISGKFSIIIPVIMVGIPIFDTLLTITRRAVYHKHIFQPDRSHFYNLMIDLKGIGHKNTVLIIYAINTVLATLSSILAFSKDVWRAASICTIIAAACLLSKWMGFIKTDSDSYLKM